MSRHSQFTTAQYPAISKLRQEDTLYVSDMEGETTAASELESALEDDEAIAVESETEQVVPIDEDNTSETETEANQPSTRRKAPRVNYYRVLPGQTFPARRSVRLHWAVYAIIIISTLSALWHVGSHFEKMYMLVGRVGFWAFVRAIKVESGRKRLDLNRLLLTGDSYSWHELFDPDFQFDVMRITLTAIIYVVILWLCETAFLGIWLPTKWLASMVKMVLRPERPRKVAVVRGTKTSRKAK